jgi:pyroglutamyl-peptidase
VALTFRVLVTGFTPFGGGESNPSGDAARELGKRDRVTVLGPQGRSLIGDIKTEVLDVLWSLPAEGDLPMQRGAADAIDALIEELYPDIVIATGMAHATFRVEQRAEDRDAPRADNNKRAPPADRREFPSEPQFLPTSLPFRKIESAWAKAGITNVEPSVSAGNFICEDVFYRVMRTAADPARRAKGLRLLRAGFIHVPAPGYTAVSRIADAVEIAIRETMLDVAPREYPAR